MFEILPRNFNRVGKLLSSGSEDLSAGASKFI